MGHRLSDILDESVDRLGELARVWETLNLSLVPYLKNMRPLTQPPYYPLKSINETLTTQLHILSIVKLKVVLWCISWKIEAKTEEESLDPTSTSV